MKRYFHVKHLEDNRAMLNLGCGTKVDKNWNNLDFLPDAACKGNAKFLQKISIITDSKYKNLLEVDPEIIVWDLRKGIPFGDNTFDVVYHSHLLEYIDKDSAPGFLKDCYRVLKPEAILRVVVPDLQKIVIRYNSAVNSIEDGDTKAVEEHNVAIYELFNKMVHKNTAKAGELHRWMYDKYSLGELMTGAGFKDIKTETANTSRIEGWTQFNLDTNKNGSVYKLESLYVEGIK